ncbi:MAG: PAS domain S-box protein [Myxococcales bacterium]|nr:PAS domain S-box protein [Myxococcales bacterium]
MENFGSQVWTDLLAKLNALSADRLRLENELQQVNALLLEAQNAALSASRSQRETIQLFVQLTSALPVVFWILESATLNVLFVSPSFETLTGLPSSDLLKDITVWRKIVHPEDMPALAERLQRLRTLEAMPDTERTFRIVRATDRAVRYVRIMVFPIFDAQGQPYRRAALLEDITERHSAEQQLRQSIDFQNSIFANAEIGIVVLAQQARFLAWNRYMEETTGFSEQDVLKGKHADVLVPSHPLLRGSEPALRGETHTEAPCVVRHHRTNREIWGQLNWGPLRDARGGISGAIGLMRDVTEQLSTEQRLRASEAMFRTLAEGSPDGLLLTQGSTIQYVNPTLLRITGYESKELIGADQAQLLPEVERDRVLPRMAEFLQKPDAQCREALELYLVRKDGRLVHVSGQSAHVHLQEGAATLTIIRDLTERDHAAGLQKNLDRERAQRSRTLEALQMVQDLSRRLANAQETESRRVARELHDDIGQLLTGLKLSLQRVDPAKIEDDTGRTALHNAQELVGDIVERVRRLSLELRPTILDDLGLFPTLRWLAERYERMMHIRVQLLARGVDRRFPPELESTAYRIAQEALTNVARHAKVNEATVRIWSDGVHLGLQIEDHGQGFHPEGSLSARQAAGLSGMMERARLLGGTCTIESRPGEGTRVTAELPLQPAAPEGLLEMQDALSRPSEPSEPNAGQTAQR